MSLMVLCSFTAFSHSLPLISSVIMVCTVPSSRQWGAIPEERVHRNLLFIKCGRCLLHSMAGASQGIVNAISVRLRSLDEYPVTDSSPHIIGKIVSYGGATGSDCSSRCLLTLLEQSLRTHAAHCCHVRIQWTLYPRVAWWLTG